MFVGVQYLFFQPYVCASEIHALGWVSILVVEIQAQGERRFYKHTFSFFFLRHAQHSFLHYYPGENHLHSGLLPDKSKLINGRRL